MFFLMFQVFDMVSNCKNSEKKERLYPKINYEFIKF